MPSQFLLPPTSIPTAGASPSSGNIISSGHLRPSRDKLRVGAEHTRQETKALLHWFPGHFTLSKRRGDTRRHRKYTRPVSQFEKKTTLLRRRQLDLLYRFLASKTDRLSHRHSRHGVTSNHTSCCWTTSGHLAVEHSSLSFPYNERNALHPNIR